MKKLLTAAVATACMLSTGAFAQALPTTKVLTAAVAHTLAQEAAAKCRADGFRVSVRVVDSGNNLKAFLRDDGAPLATLVIAELKANAVVGFGGPSGPSPGQQPGSFSPIPNTITFEGGLPIKVGNDFIGAIAVSGAPGGDKDAICAKTALEKVAGQLK